MTDDTQKNEQTAATDATSGGAAAAGDSAPEQAAAAAQTAALAEVVRAAAAESTAGGGKAAPESAPARGNAAPIAWLALLLALLIGGASLWFSMDAQRREAELLQRVRSLEATAGQDTTTFDQMRDNLLRQIELETEAMQARQLRAAEDQQRALAEQQRSMSQQVQALSRVEATAGDAAERARRQFDSQLEDLESRLVQQEQRISDLNAEDRQSWALAEAQYLLRLANQRLIMTGDTLSAEAMLKSADKILRELGDADLLDLRSALAEDIAALRAVPRLDTQGLYARLDALIQQTNALVMFELPEREAPEPIEMSDDWQTRLKQGYEAAIEKLSEYIVVSRRDVPVEVLMDPQYEGLVRQNMRMLLEQAQVAMLSGNQLLYEQSLERASGWVNQFFKNDHQAARAMSEELTSLASEPVSVDLPNSLTALDALLRQRLSRDES